jgi:hypothetical protein
LMYLSNKYEMTKARVLELAEMFAIGEFWIERIGTDLKYRF